MYEEPDITKKRKKISELDFDSMPLEEKRKHYKCGKCYVTLNDIQTWPAYVQENGYYLFRKQGHSSDLPGKSLYFIQKLQLLFFERVVLPHGS